MIVDQLPEATEVALDDELLLEQGTSAKKVKVRRLICAGPVATDAANGLMSAEDKAALDNVPTTYLKKENVVNNLTTTVEGYALDARQGKDMKDSLDELNGNIGDLNGLATTEKNNLVAAINELVSGWAVKVLTLTATGSISLSNCSAVLIGKVLVLNINFTDPVAPKEYTQLGVINGTTVRAQYSVIAVTSRGKDPVMVEVLTNGAIRLYNYGSDPSNGWVRAQLIVPAY